MDWFSWLSRTGLEPPQIYEYGVSFTRNELQLEDAAYFNHEFLQSIGISIAKHRLEILKLAKNEGGPVLLLRPKKISGVFRKCLRKCMTMTKWALFREEEPPPVPNWHHGKWRGAQRNRNVALSGPLDGRIMHEKMVNSKGLKLSGPLDGKVNEKMGFINRSPIIARPLDGRFIMGPVKSPRLFGPHGARVMMVHNRSPRLTRPSDEMVGESPMGYSPYNKTKAESDCDDDYYAWPTLFQDLKPT